MDLKIPGFFLLGIGICSDKNPGIKSGDSVLCILAG
jgi:hypothetical protein